MMLMILLMEDDEQSGRKRVGEVQQGEERRGASVGLNNDRRFLLVWIMSFSPEIIVTSGVMFVRVELTAALIFF